MSIRPRSQVEERSVAEAPLKIGILWSYNADQLDRWGPETYAHNLRMNAISIRPYSDSTDRQHIVALWKSALGYNAAHNDPELAIDKKVAMNDCLLFVAVDGDVVVGTIMGGYDGHRGWIYSLAVAPSYRRQGIGTRLMARVEEALTTKGCMKINLQIAEGNECVAEFYAALGYTIEKRVSMGKRILQNIPQL